MGSKGTQTQTQTGQTYSANPLTQGAAAQAISGAQNAASQPFQMPIAPVAGFNPTQNQAFNQFQQLQGTATPFYNQAATDINASVAPVTAADVNQYYNPMADNVTAQMKNIFGQQNVQNQGNLTQQAGGVGADRIAVGMGDLANQQGLAAGQTYAGLYQQALQQAQIQKQMAATGGTNLQNLGTTTQQTAIQGAQSLLGTGNQQQAQTQAQLNAPYQNQLAQIAYQFQTPQYLAGITGGLSGALGGTTTGNQVTTPPSPTTAAQIAGLATAGTGLVGALWPGGGSNGGSAYQNSTGNYMGMSNAQQDNLQDTGFPLPAARGGKVEGFDEGGQTDQAQPLPFPGASVPKMGGAEPIPYISMPMSVGHSGPLTGAINTAPPQQSGSGSNNSIGSDISTALGVAKAVAPLFALKRGGTVQGYDGGGDVDPSKPIEGMPAPMQAPWPFNSAHSEMGGSGAMVPNEPPIYSLLPGKSKENYSFSKLGSDISNLFGSKATAQADDPSVFRPKDPTTPLPTRDPRKAETLEKMEKKGSGAGSGSGSGSGAAAPAAASGFTPPYPDALNRDVGQTMTRSPWMALVNAGAAMMSTPGNLGTSIGKGIQAGAGVLDNQRKELHSEQELNDKAQKLYQEAQVHLDKYNKMTPYERAEIGLRNRELDQSETGGDGKPIKEVDIARISKALMENPNSPYFGKDPIAIRNAAIDLWHRTHGGKAGASNDSTATPGPGSSAQNALPYGSAPEVGKWYKTQDGKQARQYTGG